MRGMRGPSWRTQCQSRPMGARPNRAQNTIRRGSGAGANTSAQAASAIKANTPAATPNLSVRSDAMLAQLAVQGGAADAQGFRGVADIAFELGQRGGYRYTLQRVERHVLAGNVGDIGDAGDVALGLHSITGAGCRMVVGIDADSSAQCEIAQAI